jgi:hypothetical protein
LTASNAAIAVYEFFTPVYKPADIKRNHQITPLAQKDGDFRINKLKKKIFAGV